MTQFIRDKAGASEPQQKMALSYLFAQDSAGLASDGVLTGLAVSQTGSASASVVIGKGSGVAQDSVLNGASMMVLDTDLTLDVLGVNPMGGLPRNDIIVFDAATISGGAGGVRVIVGTPNASPTDPSVPATAIPLARLRHAASATTVPTSVIDSLRVFTSLVGAATSSNRINGVPFAGASTTKAAKRMHWNQVTVTPNATGYATITHGAGFTPTVATASSQWVNTAVDPDQITSTTIQVRILNTASAAVTSPTKVSYFCGE